MGEVVNLAKRELIKSQFEAMKKSAKVKEISKLKQKSKRKFKIDGPSRAEDNGTERKILREEKRYELMLRHVLDGTRILMSDKKRRKILND